MSTNRFRFFVITLFFFALLSGCGPESTLSASPTARNQAVDLDFREYYDRLGGKSILGQFISDKFDLEGATCQFTENVLMCRITFSPTSVKLYLYPLGLKLNMNDAPDAFQNPDNWRVENGYLIHPNFLSLFYRVNEKLAFGKPLTTVRRQYKENQVIQVFENAAFAFSFDRPADVYLLPLGRWFCGSYCSSNSPQPTPTPTLKIHPSFELQIGYIGGHKIVGSVLTQAYKGSDGRLEQVFETLIIYESPTDPKNVRLRPLTSMLGLKSSKPTFTKADERQGWLFYPVSEPYGFLVPVQFDQFIAAHGGKDLAGKPISESITMPENGILRQCFESYCLDYDKKAPSEFMVGLAPLGLQYIQNKNQITLTITPSATRAGTTLTPIKTPLSTLTITPELSRKNIQLQVSKLKDQISNNEKQIISIDIKTVDTQQPLMNIEAVLTLRVNSFPVEYKFPLTGKDGKASLMVGPFSELGRIQIPFEVCLLSPVPSGICSSGVFLIWTP